MTPATIDCPSCGGTAVLLGSDDDDDVAIYACMDCDQQFTVPRPAG